MGDMVDLINEREHYESDGDEICTNCGLPWSLCDCDDEDFVDD